MGKTNQATPKNSPKPNQGKGNQASTNKVSRLEELQGLSEAELRERYIATFAKDPEEGATAEQMIAAINEAAPKPPTPTIEPGEVVEEGGKVYGNKDSKKQYPIQKDWKNKVVVRQWKVERASNGELVNLQSTEEIQTYDPKYYEKLLKDNFFGESRMQVQVLHQPR